MLLIAVVLYFAAWPLYPQEDEIQVEESAEVFLEEYTDEFQNTFFEALKQKSIQNYDRAINLLLECKQLDVGNAAVDHELAKTYVLDKKYVSAQPYAIEALLGEPNNYWYLHTLVTVMEKQSTTLESLQNTIPYKNESLRENLALIYFHQNKYSEARNVLKGLQASDFSKDLALKINDSLNKKEVPQEKITVNEAPKSSDSEWESFRTKLEGLMAESDYKTMSDLAEQALEAYPLQPYFYYINGMALNRRGKPKEGVEVMELGLDYLIDDAILANKFYKELGDAYMKLGNTSKANMYFSKVKPGS